MNIYKNKEAKTKQRCTIGVKKTKNTKQKSEGNCTNVKTREKQNKCLNKEMDPSSRRRLFSEDKMAKPKMANGHDHFYV